MPFDLLDIVDKATGAVPAVKYAVGILGLTAVVAIVVQFGIDMRIAVWGTVILLALMILLVVFARLTETAAEEFKAPVKVLMWAFVLLFIGNCILLSSAAFTGWPRLHSLLPDSKKNENPIASIRDTTRTKVATKDSAATVPAGVHQEIKIDSSPGSIGIIGNNNKVQKKE